MPAGEDLRQDQRRIAVIQAAAGSLTILAAVPGERIKLIGLAGSLTVAGTLKLQSNATDLTGPMNLAAGTPIQLTADDEHPLVITAPGQALNLVTTLGGFNGFADVYVEGQ